MLIRETRESQKEGKILAMLARYEEGSVTSQGGEGVTERGRDTRYSVPPFRLSFPHATASMLSDC